MLPYIEQGAFHDIGLGKGAAAKNALWTKAVATPMTALFCPTRGKPTACPLSAWQTSGGMSYANITMSAVTLVAHNDYVINAGPMEYNNYPSDTPYNDTPDGVVGSRISSTGCHKKVLMSSITDGTSKTYLIGEKYVDPDNYLDSGDGGYNDSAYCGHDWDNARYTYYTTSTNITVISGVYYPRQDQPGLAGLLQYFGSAHAGSFNMAFCDGSVQSINYAIDGAVHACLGNRHDGQVIPPALTETPAA